MWRTACWHGTQLFGVDNENNSRDICSLSLSWLSTRFGLNAFWGTMPLSTASVNRDISGYIWYPALVELRWRSLHRVARAFTMRDRQLKSLHHVQFTRPIRWCASDSCLLDSFRFMPVHTSSSYISNAKSAMANLRYLLVSRPFRPILRVSKVMMTNCIRPLPNMSPIKLIDFGWAAVGRDHLLKREPHCYAILNREPKVCFL
jgi:hypothetical protein